MVNRDAPYVNWVTMDTNGVLIEFDKYMDTATLTGNIQTSCSDNTAFTLSFPDAEADPEDSNKLYARKAQLTASKPMAVGTGINITISGNVSSYAGTVMGDDYFYEGSIRGLESFTADSLDLDKGEYAYINIYSEPAEVSAGKTVTISGDTTQLGIENTTIALNAFGRYGLPVHTSQYGTFNLNLSLDGTAFSTTVTVDVSPEQFSFVNSDIALAKGIGFANERTLEIDDLDAEGLVWTTSNSSVVTVQNGTITAVKAGTATITAAAGSTYATCNVQVYGNLKGLTLPSGLTEIEEEAFAGNNAIQYVVIPNSVSSIDDNAFSGDSKLMFVYIPESVVSFGDNVFDYDVTVYGKDGSNAEAYCEQNGIEFVED